MPIRFILDRSQNTIFQAKTQDEFNLSKEKAFSLILFIFLLSERIMPNEVPKLEKSSQKFNFLMKQKVLWKNYGPAQHKVIRIRTDVRKSLCMNISQFGTL